MSTRGANGSVGIRALEPGDSGNCRPGAVLQVAPGPGLRPGCGRDRVASRLLCRRLGCRDEPARRRSSTGSQLSSGTEQSIKSDYLLADRLGEPSVVRFTRQQLLRANANCGQCL